MNTDNGLLITEDELKAIGLTKVELIKRALRKWGDKSKTRARLAARQGGISAVSNMPVSSNGRECHIDHIWTMQEAAEAVASSQMGIVEAHQKLWADGNLRVITTAENYARNRK